MLRRADIGNVAVMRLPENSQGFKLQLREQDRRVLVQKEAEETLNISGFLIARACFLVISLYI